MNSWKIKYNDSVFQQREQIYKIINKTSWIQISVQITYSHCSQNEVDEHQMTELAYLGIDQL